MKKLKPFIKLLRPEHYLKNGLILLPAFFGGRIFDIPTLTRVTLGFLAFSLFSSAVYIINDLCDAERDRMHPEKRSRPIASGAVSPRAAALLLCSVILLALAADAAAAGISAAAMLPILYLVLNIGYSLKFKHSPIVDICLLVSGFFLRVLYGALATGIWISPSMYLAVISLSCFLVIGKRRNEKRNCGSGSRPVIEKYGENFLNMNMYAYLTLFLAFYSAWAIQGSKSTEKLLTIPLVMLITLRYSYLVERPNSHGDPVGVILKDGAIILLGIFYAAFMSAILYLPEVAA